MTDLCRQFEEWLDAAEAGPPAGNLAAHAAGCEVCGRRLAIDRLIRTGLAGGVALDAARQRILVDGIVATVAQPPSAVKELETGDSDLADSRPRAAEPHSQWTAARGRSRRKWPWAAAVAAAAAAVVLGIGIFRPEHRQPVAVSPTQVFADLLGPLADVTPPPPQAAAPADTNSSPLGPVLAAIWGDFEAPLSVGLDAIKAPRAVASDGKGPAPSPAGSPPAVKKEG